MNIFLFINSTCSKFTQVLCQLPILGLAQIWDILQVSSGRNENKRWGKSAAYANKASSLLTGKRATEWLYIPIIPGVWVSSTTKDNGGKEYQSWRRKNGTTSGYFPPVIKLQYPFLCSETFKLFQLICHLSIFTQALQCCLYLYLICLYTQLLDLNRRHLKYQSLIILESIWNIKRTGACGIQRQMTEIHDTN